MMKFNWKTYTINIVNIILSFTSLSILKLHDLTSFHVFISLFFLIIGMYVIVDKIERNKRIHKSNIFYSALVLFYITYSVVAKEVLITNIVITNLISSNLLLIALGSSFKRSVLPEWFQERLLLFYFITLCFPINILQSTPLGFLFIRKLLFLILFNLELYIGKLLEYKTNYKQLFLISYFVFVVDEWYLIGAFILVLSHFLEISHKLYKKKTVDNAEEYSESESESDVEEVVERKFLIGPSKKTGFSNLNLDF